jgi:hypothetical protein
MMPGALPYPPMNDTMNMTLLEVGDGRTVFQGIPLLPHYNPLARCTAVGLPRFWIQRSGVQSKLRCRPGVPTRRQNSA